MSVRILVGDCRTRLRELPEQSVQTCVTSPPYFGLRDYGHADQIGLEKTPDAFVAELVSVFREVKRVLRDDGTLWLNLGDSYVGPPRGNKNGWDGSGLNGIESESYKERLTEGTATTADKSKIDGLKQKDLIGIPWRVAFALQADGWYLRSDIIWHKPSCMPEKVFDRPTKSHEYLFLLSKSARYSYDCDSVREDSGANKRSVWSVNPQPFKGTHFATFPPALIEPCILAGCPKDGVVLDPFGGAGTTGLVADRLGRNAILCELNPRYAQMAADRITNENPMFAQVSTE